MWMGILAAFSELVNIVVGITTVLACYALQQTLNTLVRAQQSGLAQPSSPQQHPPHRGHALGYHTSGDGGIQSTTTTAPLPPPPPASTGLTAWPSEKNGTNLSSFNNTLAPPGGAVRIPPLDTSSIAATPVPSSSARGPTTTTTTKQKAATDTTHLFAAMRRLWRGLASALIVLIGVTVTDAGTVATRLSSPYHPLPLGNKEKWIFSYPYLLIMGSIYVLIWWAWVPLRPKVKNPFVVAPAPVAASSLPPPPQQQVHPLPIIIVHHYRTPMLSSPRE
jgi:hypothetical protein